MSWGLFTLVLRHHEFCTASARLSSAMFRNVACVLSQRAPVSNQPFSLDAPPPVSSRET